MVSNEEVKARVDRHLEEAGMTHEQVWSALGMTESGYYRMWKRKSMKHAIVEALARVLDVPVAELTQPIVRSSMVHEQMPAPIGRPRYLEQRVALLERQVRELLDVVKVKS